MAKHRSMIAIEHDADQEARVTVGPPDDQSWFRLFRGLVRTLVWANLGSAARSVLIVLAESVNDHLRRENGQWLAWPSVPTIAKRAGLAERNVYVALRELEAKNLIRKIAPGGGRRQTTYELQAPKPVDLPAERPSASAASPVMIPSGVTKASGVTKSTSQPGPLRHGTPDPAISQQRQSELRLNNSSSSEASEAFTALRNVGVAEPMLSRVAAEHPEKELLLRIQDWKNRNAAGSKLGVAWLIASIQQKYNLHEKTRDVIERREQAAAAHANRVRQLELDAAEERRQREIEEQVQALFDAMSDEELAHWKDVVVTEFPSLIKNPERADPRAHERLRRLILGKLAHLVCPPNPSPGTARPPAAKRRS